MSKFPLTLLILVAFTAVQLGCDSQASQQAEALRHLDAARATLQQANAGYVAMAEGQNQQPKELLVYRQDTMDAALEELNKVMSLDAPQEKVQAICLIAQINASAARHAARSAALEEASLAGRSTVLLGYLDAIEGATTRAAELQPQTSEQLAKLQQEIQTQSDNQAQLSAEVSELDDQLQAVSAEVEQFKARAEDGYAQAQTLREKAFVAQGQRSYDLQNQAAEIERKAAIESASAEQRQVTANDLAAKLAMSRVQLDTVNKLLDELNKQVNDTRVETARLADAADAATKAGEEAIATLAEEYKQLADVFAEGVQKNMKKAGEKADLAVQALHQASQRSYDATDTETIKLQLLSAYLDQAYVATSGETYLRDFAHTTRAILNSVNRVSPAAAEPYKQQLAALTDSQVALHDKAKQAIDAGLALAEELAPEGTSPEDGGVQAIALKQKNRLGEYRDRLNAVNNDS